MDKSFEQLAVYGGGICKLPFEKSFSTLPVCQAKGTKPVRLEINGVSKRYKDVWALRGVSLRVGVGVLGLLGPNGAGKSTLMSIIATITRPTDGSITWDGSDIVQFPDNLRVTLGYLPQDFGVYPNITAIEFLEYLAAIKGLDHRQAKNRIDELIQVFNLFEARNRPLGGYSGGMKQRVGLAQALLNDPQLLIIDEPTVGLDPEERVTFRSLLSDLSGDRIVILSTHIISDVEAAATQIALISSGKLLLDATPETLLKTVENKVWEWVIPSSELVAVKQRYAISSALRRSDGIHVRAVADEEPGVHAKPAIPTLEDAYLYYISSNRGKHTE